MDTLQRISIAALSLLSKRWYQTVSVAEICRTAGVSNGVFYRYFRSKDELLASLLDSFLDRFSADLDKIDGATIDERISHLVTAVAGAAHRYAEEVTVFREGQYVMRQYETQLHALYQRTVARLYGRPISSVEYLYLLAGVRFVATRALYHDLTINNRLLTDFLLRGVFPEARGTLEIPAPPRPPEPAAHGPKERLVEAGLELFGDRGVHEVQVVDIARLAGYSVGTFYNHFESKESFLSRVVSEIGHRTRVYLRRQQRTDLPRWQQEVLGIAHFLEAFDSHRNFYEIVREAEFVVPQTVREYYDAFERGYCEGLTGFEANDRPVVANFLMGLSHYIGIEVLLQQSITDRHALLVELGGLLRSGIPS